MSAGEICVERDDESAPFFDGTAAGKLLIRRCDRCGAFSAPEARVCANCHGGELSWVPASGRGRIVTWTIERRRDDPRPECVSALVELDEGPWIPARIVAPASALSGGMLVEVAFETPGDNGGEAVPVFYPHGRLPQRNGL